MINKKEKFNRLAQYAAASASFLTLHNSAEAVVVYRGIDPDSTIVLNDTILIDIDQNGTNDIMFWIESEQDTIITSGGDTVNYLYRFARASALGSNQILGDAATHDGFVFENASKFYSGEVIGDTSPYFADDALLAAGIFLSGALIYSYSDGEWNDTDGNFLGVRFKIDGFNHYAWIRLRIGPAGDEITVKDLAYDDVNDIPVTAGITAAFENLQGNDTPEISVNSGKIDIHFSSPQRNFRYEISDMEGKKIAAGACVNASTVINCPGYAPGMYIVNVFNEKSAFSKKIVITAL